MERSEHLQWCKDRANEYVQNGDVKEAFASFQSDMSKHEGTANHKALDLGLMLLLSGNLSDAQQMTHWIDGFD